MDPRTGIDRVANATAVVPAAEVTDTPSGLVDTPPKNGEFADWDGAQHDPETVAEGNRLGQTIDVDDDDDNGGV